MKTDEINTWTNSPTDGKSAPDTEEEKRSTVTNNYDEATALKPRRNCPQQSRYLRVMIKEKYKNRGPQSLHPNTLLRETSTDGKQKTIWWGRTEEETEGKEKALRVEESSGNPQQDAKQGTNSVQKLCKGHTLLG